MAASTSISVAETAKLFGDVFKYREEKNKSQCLLLKDGIECGRLLAGKRPSNLKRHVERCHKDYKKMIIENKCSDVISLEELLNVCVEITTVNGRPFSIVNDSGFRNLLNILLAQIEKYTGNKENITIPRVQNQMRSICYETKKKIIDETKNQLISLQLDIATKNHRGILGVNIQYVKDSKVVLRTLKMINLTRRHTGENLANEVKQVLEEFGITLRQIYSITTDNGPNVLLSAEILNDLAEALENEIELEGTLEEIEAEFSDEILKETKRELFHVDFIPDYIVSLSCGAHTFQLAMKDALLHSTEATNLIEKCREIMKKLRTPTIFRAIREKGLHFPYLDNDTRWSGKYLMVRHCSNEINWF